MISLQAFCLKAVFPSIDGLKGIEGTDYKTFLKQYSRDMPFAMKAGFNLSCLVFVFSTPFTIKSAKPAFFLSKRRLDEHARAFAAISQYHINLLRLIIYTAGGLCWMQDPEIREHFSMKPFSGNPGTWRRP